MTQARQQAVRATVSQEVSRATASPVVFRAMVNCQEVSRATASPAPLRAVPLADRTHEKTVKAIYFKGRIMGHFFHSWVTQRKNDIFGDPLIKGALELYGRVSAELSEKARGLTGLENPNSIQQLKTWVFSSGMKAVLISWDSRSGTSPYIALTASSCLFFTSSLARSNLGGGACRVGTGKPE